MLEQIRKQQQGAGSASGFGTAASVYPIAATNLQATGKIEPALDAGNFRNFGCSDPLIHPGLPRPALRTLNPEDFLASKRIPIKRTMFDAEWSRVSHDRLSRGQFRRYIGAAHTDRIALIGNVNRWVNRNINYVEDIQLFGQGDHWAGAKQTLRLRMGDCEDIALVKMQLLAAAGVRRQDMVLTIARDLVRNADHAVLLVRQDNGFLLLDNTTDQLLDGSYSHDYRPIMSFAEDDRWLHGYPAAAAGNIQRSVIASSSAFVTGLNR